MTPEEQLKKLQDDVADLRNLFENHRHLDFDHSKPLEPGNLGDVVGPASSVDSEVALFNGTTGKLLKSATITGLAKLTAGVLSAATAGVDYIVDLAYVVGTYLTFNNHWITVATFLDADLGWTVSALTNTHTLTGTYIDNNGACKAYIALHCRGTSASANMQWSTGPTFRAKYFWITGQTSSGTAPLAGTDRTTWHGFAGTSGADLYGDINDVSERVGFAYYNNTMYTVTADGSGITANSLGGEPGTSGGKEYWIVFNGGTSVDFYVNGTLAFTHTTNIPSGANNILFNASSYRADGSGTGFFTGNIVISIKVA